MDREKLEETLQEMRSFKKASAEEFEAGLMSKLELENGLSRLYDMFDESLWTLGLNRRKPLTNENLARYAEDYGRWAEGGKPDSTIGDPWLLRQTKGLDHYYFAKGIKAWEPWLLRNEEDWETSDEASSDERAAYFQLAREALIEISIREIPPDDLEKPERYMTGLGGHVTVLFDCVDDDGLIVSEDPRGQRFVLTDSKGLHAEIEVDARAGYEYKPMWEKGSQYHGLISVEGYTVPGLHSTGVVEINEGRIAAVTYDNYSWISSCDKHVDKLCTPEEYDAAKNARKNDETPFHISTAQGERNEEAFRSFPRWRPYFKWLDEHPTKLLSPSRGEYIDMLLEGA